MDIIQNENHLRLTWRDARQRKLVLFRPLQRLGPAPRPVLIVGVFEHVQGPQALCLVDERPLVVISQQLPVRT